MRIAGLWGDRLSNAQYRVELPLRALAARGHAVETHVYEPERVGALVDRLRSADVVHVWRLYQAPVRRMLRALREAGVAIVWDNDDDLLNFAPERVRDGRYTLAREQLHREIADVLKLADAVTTASDELARRFRRIGAANVTVVDNYVPDESVRTAAHASMGDAIVVGWLAGSEHRTDLKQLRIRPTLERVQASHPRLRVVGVGLDLGLRGDRYHWQPPVSFADLSATVAQFDIGIAPLANVSFNRGRSRVKLKEYAAAGVPWLASPIGPYRGLGEAQGGRLVPDALWRSSIEELVEDAGARRALADASAAWGRTQTIGENAHCWEAVFEAAHKRACARSGRAEPVAIAREAPAPATPPARGGVLARLRRHGRA